VKSLWNSIRSAVTVMLVTTLCVFIIGFVYLGKVEGKEGLRVLETIVLIVLAYYFSRKRPNGETEKPEPPSPLVTEATRILPPPVTRVK